VAVRIRQYLSKRNVRPLKGKCEILRSATAAATAAEGRRSGDPGRVVVQLLLDVSEDRNGGVTVGNYCPTTQRNMPQNSIFRHVLI
jgi:hypothetical protein